MISETQITEIKQIINKKTNIAISMHHNPDGDTIACALALYHFYTKQHKTVHVITPNAFPYFLSWMPGADAIINYERQNKDASNAINDADVLFSVDYNEVDRAGDVAHLIKKSDAVKILIDHHPMPGNFADYIFSDTSVSSAAELVYDFMYACNPEIIDKTIAECIFVGISTDTGNFSFNSSNPETYELIAKLLRLGINKDEIHRKVYNENSLNRIRLLGNTLNNMHVIPEYNAAYVVISAKDKEKGSFQPGDSEGFVNYPLSIKGIVFSVLFMENENFVKLSLRSRGSFDVNQFARKYFNGGGHTNAAGGRSHDSLEKTLERFVSLLDEAKEYLVNSITISK